MSVYNIVRKHEILETNIKSEESINFYLIFNIFVYFSILIDTGFFLKNCNVFFSCILFPVMGLFECRYARTQFFLYSGISTVSH